VNPLDVLDKSKAWECMLGNASWIPTADEVDRILKCLDKLGIKALSVPSVAAGHEFFNKRGDRIALFGEVSTRQTIIPDPPAPEVVEVAETATVGLASIPTEPEVPKAAEVETAPIRTSCRGKRKPL